MLEPSGPIQWAGEGAPGKSPLRQNGSTQTQGPVTCWVLTQGSALCQVLCMHHDLIHPKMDKTLLRPWVFPRYKQENKDSGSVLYKATHW